MPPDGLRAALAETAAAAVPQDVQDDAMLEPDVS
jgi:hypothetical protein